MGFTSTSGAAVVAAAPRVVWRGRRLGAVGTGGAAGGGAANRCQSAAKPMVFTSTSGAAMIAAAPRIVWRDRRLRSMATGGTAGRAAGDSASAVEVTGRTGAGDASGVTFVKVAVGSQS